MRFLTDITIEQAIAHHLDHLIPEKVISRRLLKITEELHLYLSAHIISVSRLSSLVAAKFHEEPGEVGKACHEILSGKLGVVDGSIQIAERLFSVMGNNRTLSPGLLLICKVKDNERNRRFIVILKMESQPVFKEERKKSEKGEVYIELAVDAVALPSPGRHIQKCAFIKEEHTSSQPEILLIDKQARDAAVAGFFHERFLQAEYCRDSHFRTKKFVREFVKWANKARQEHRLTPEQLDSTLAGARDLLKEKRISLPEFIGDVIENRGEQNNCLEVLAKKQVEPKFETEPKASEKFRKTGVIKLDHGVQIRMPHHRMMDKDFYEASLAEEDQTVTVITIKTRKYQIT